MHCPFQCIVQGPLSTCQAMLALLCYLLIFLSCLESQPCIQFMFLYCSHCRLWECLQSYYLSGFWGGKRLGLVFHHTNSLLSCFSVLSLGCPLQNSLLGEWNEVGEREVLRKICYYSPRPNFRPQFQNLNVELKGDMCFLILALLLNNLTLRRKLQNTIVHTDGRWRSAKILQEGKWQENIYIKYIDLYFRYIATCMLIWFHLRPCFYEFSDHCKIIGENPKLRSN